MTNLNELYKKWCGEEPVSLEKIEGSGSNRQYFRIHGNDGQTVIGAAGDALGYPVEFMSRRAILQQYGEQGITEFEIDKRSGKALVSDDTQMTLFTANGMLMGLTRGYMRGIGDWPHKYVDGAYLDWYYTQAGKKQDVFRRDFHNKDCRCKNASE